METNFKTQTVGSMYLKLNIQEAQSMRIIIDSTNKKDWGTLDIILWNNLRDATDDFVELIRVHEGK